MGTLGFVSQMTRTSSASATSGEGTSGSGAGGAFGNGLTAFGSSEVSAGARDTAKMGTTRGEAPGWGFAVGGSAAAGATTGPPPGAVAPSSVESPADGP